MTRKVGSSQQMDNLRRKAEKMVTSEAPHTLESQSLEQMQRLIQELQVHKIELQLQNEEMLRTRQELEESRERYIDLFDHAPVAYLTLNQNGLILEANLTAATMLGEERDLLTGKPLSRYIHARYQDILYLHQRQLVQTGMSPSCELRLRNQSGHLWVSLTSTVVIDGNTAEVRIRAVLSDISERRQQEKSQDESREMLSLFMHYTPIYTFIKEVTPDRSRVLQASENYQQMIGIPGSKMVGKCMEELFPAEFAVKMTADDWGVVSGNRILELEEEFNGRSYTSIKFPILRGDKNLLAGFTIDITERKKAEEARRESESKYRVLFDTVQDAIFLTVAADGRIVECSDNLSGYTKEELIGNSTEALGLWANLDERNQVIALVKEKGKVNDFEATFRRKNGSCFPGSISTNPISLGGETYLLSVVRDISERKATELELKKLNLSLEARVKKRTAELHSVTEHLSLALKAAKAGTWEWDLKTDENRWSDDLWQLYGLEPWSCNPSFGAWLEQIHPDHRAPAEQVVREAARMGVARDLEYRVRDVNGEERWLKSFALPVQGLDGLVERFIGIVMDISGQKQVEESLRSSEEQFRLMANCIPGMVWSVNADGTLDFMNNAVRDYSGLGDGFKGLETVIEMVHPDDRDLTRQVMTNAFQTGTPYYREHRLQRHDGVYRWHLARGLPLRNDLGEIIRWYGTTIDIQDLREAQRNMNAMAMEVAIAEERERCRIAGELHDQVAPNLLYCMMTVRALESVHDPAEKEQAIAAIEKNLADTVNDIRSLTFQLRPPILANAGLESALKWLAEEFREKYGLTIRIIDGETSLRIVPDIRFMLYQVIRELLMNVVKHAHSPEALIVILREPGELAISVEDDGVGFDAGKVAGFSSGNVGFGLFSIQQKVECLGGKFVINSVPGKGTSICIVLNNCFETESKENES